MAFECSEGMRRGRITEQEGCVDAPAKRVKGKMGDDAAGHLQNGSNRVKTGPEFS
jgi:hypothetical protein